MCETVNASALFQVEDNNRFAFFQEVDNLISVICLSLVDIEPNPNLLKFAGAFQVFFDLNFRCSPLDVNLGDGPKTTLVLSATICLMV